jgi:hypothetical protein
MKDTLLSRLEIALKRGAPALHDMVKTLDSEGHSQLEILDAYYQLFDKIRRDDRELEEDAVENEIEMIVGWCSPHLRQEFHRPCTKGEYERYMKQRTDRYKGKISF